MVNNSSDVLQDIDLVSLYNELNNSYKKKCLFFVGHSAGLFSEINNMIFAMLYCLANKIKFVPYSKESNFGNTEGWQEFFKPFAEEFNDDVPKRINYRTKNCVEVLLKRKYTKRVIFEVMAAAFKLKHGFSYLTHDISCKTDAASFFSTTFDIKQLGIYGGYLSASKNLAKMLWRFNQKTEAEIADIVASLGLPTEYVAIHVRSGDKFTETYRQKIKLMEVDSYMERIKAKGLVNNVFVFADNYNQIEQLRNKYPNYNFYTFCEPKENGYYNKAFQALSWDEKRPKLLNLFASMEICRSATFFLGTEQANPDLFLKMLMNPEKIELFHYSFNAADAKLNR